jgi:hypothetical protein
LVTPRTQLEEDAFQAWINARNCLLYEKDPGPDRLNVGTTQEPRMVPRAEAWQHGYALRVLVQCNGDHSRLAAAARQCQEKMTGKAHDAQRAREWSRAADLCERAAHMVAEAGAVEDDKARRRLVAACQHETMIIAMGAIPEAVEQSRQALLETMREIDQEP